jgi:four helix bundle protein
MREPSEARKRTLALHTRAIAFSNRINQSYPAASMSYPSEVVWKQLVRAGDSTSNNLVEAGDGCTDADFLHRMRTALREAKESRACLQKIRMGPLANAGRVIELGLEQEAEELCAIFATIIINMERRLASSRKRRGNERLKD